MKRCIKCDQIMPVTEFYANRKGTLTACKSCQHEAVKARRDAYRFEVNLFKRIKGCSDCGARPDNLRLLHLDHVDPLTKSFDIAAGWRYSHERRVAELLKCEVRCQGCHAAKTKANGDRAKGMARNALRAAVSA